MKPVLQIQQVTKVYGKNNQYTALNHINIAIEQGDFVGVMGPSGAGKSTLLNIASTIDTPTSGVVMIDGSDISKLTQTEMAKFRREKLGFIFQDFNLLDTLTVEENIALPLALSKVDHKIIKKKVNEIAKVLGIQDLLTKYPYEISGGQKQRTAACRAMITQPSLILADEPTGALDSKSATSLLESMQELNEKSNATIMMVTHDSVAASYCKKVLFIKDGVLFKEVRRKGTQKEFFHELMNIVVQMGGE